MEYFRNPCELVINDLRLELEYWTEQTQDALDNYNSVSSLRWRKKNRAFENVILAHENLLDAQEEYNFIKHCMTGE